MLTDFQKDVSKFKKNYTDIGIIFSNEDEGISFSTTGDFVRDVWYLPRSNDKMICKDKESPLKNSKQNKKTKEN